MARYKIIRIYEVAGKDQIEATNRMMEALTLGVERHYHVMDYVKAADDPASKGKKISLAPPKGWMATFLEQLLGRSSDAGEWKTPKIYKGKSQHELEAEGLESER